MGPRNTPLLSSVNLFSESATKAENRLLEKLNENDTSIRSKFSKAKTMKQFGNSGSEFRLHGEKMIFGLHEYLTQGPVRAIPYSSFSAPEPNCNYLSPSRMREQ
jgi:hypothetical protein